MDTILFVFGTQGGTAYSVALRLAKFAQESLGVPSKCVSADDLLEQPLPWQGTFVFVVSTTGQGEVPPNMTKLWRTLLRKDMVTLERLNFTIFGLGDSSYPLYNATARKLWERLIQLGARSFCPRGLGDDQDDTGLEFGLSMWSPMLWLCLVNHLLNLHCLNISDAPAFVSQHCIESFNSLRSVDEAVLRSLIFNIAPDSPFDMRSHLVTLLPKLQSLIDSSQSVAQSVAIDSALTQYFDFEMLPSESLTCDPTRIATTTLYPSFHPVTMSQVSNNNNNQSTAPVPCRVRSCRELTAVAAASVGDIDDDTRFRTVVELSLESMDAATQRNISSVHFIVAIPIFPHSSILHQI